MSDQNTPVEPEEWLDPDADELRRLEEHLDQLEEEGVLVKGDGIRGSLRHGEAETIDTAGHETVEESEELRQLFKQLAELRAKGIISGGEGPRDSLKPTAHVPGAFARFLADGR